MAGLLGDGEPQQQGGLLGMDPYQLAQVYSLLTARKGDNVGLNIAALASQRQQAALRAQQMKAQQMQLEQQQRQSAQQQQVDQLAHTSFAPGTPGVGPMPDGSTVMEGAGGGMQAYVQGMQQIDPVRAMQIQAQQAALNQKDNPFNKVDPKDYTPESVARFSQSHNFADLRPRDKIISEDLGGKRAYRTEYSTTALGEAPKTASPDAIAADARARSEGAANRDVTMRGQDMTDARTREAQAQGKQPSEQELVASGYAGRMQAAEAIIGKVGKAGGPSNMTFLAANTPKVGPVTKRALERFVMTPEQQQYRQAQEDWVRAKLRKESGAVIADDEMQREIETYFPQLGDLDPVKKQKAKSRAVAIQAMATAAGKAGGRAADVAGARPPLESFNQ